MSNSYPNKKMAHKKIQFPADTPNGQSVLRFGAELFDRGDSYTILVLLGLVIGALFYKLDRVDPFPAKTIETTAPVQVVSAPVPEQVVSPPVLVEEDLTNNLMDKLKTAGLWDLHGQDKVPMLIVNSYPADFHVFEDITLRKKLFLNTLLPPALLARHEVALERSRLQSILAKINCPSGAVNFTGKTDGTTQCAWQDLLSTDEISFIKELCSTYRSTSAQELLARVRPLPVSLILAQGALETSWGRSRFAREGNSIFGMWTWKTKGMVPSEREMGKTHKVKAYDSILDSIRAYQLTLNRLKQYELLRNLRLKTDDSLILAEGLSLYSQRGNDYVNDIKNVILSNELQTYDSYTLKGIEGVSSLEEISRIDTVYQTAKVSL